MQVNHVLIITQIIKHGKTEQKQSKTQKEVQGNRTNSDDSVEENPRSDGVA